MDVLTEGRETRTERQVARASDMLIDRSASACEGERYAFNRGRHLGHSTTGSGPSNNIQLRGPSGGALAK